MNALSSQAHGPLASGIQIKQISQVHITTTTCYTQVPYIMIMYLSLGMLVPNSRDQHGKPWFPNALENNLTITCPSNTSHKSLSTKLIAP